MLAAVVTVALLVTVLLGLVWSQQRRLIYFPWPGPGSVVGAGRQPGGRPRDRGRHSAGRLVLPTRGGRGPAVLACNGNAGNRALRTPLAAALSVLLFDYRG